MDIQLGEVFSSAELGYELGDQWERVFFLDCHGIECTIIVRGYPREQPRS